MLKERKCENTKENKENVKLDNEQMKMLQQEAFMEGYQYAIQILQESMIKKIE